MKEKIPVVFVYSMYGALYVYCMTMYARHFAFQNVNSDKTGDYAHCMM